MPITMADEGKQRALLSDRGHPMPRRTTPEKSVTLRHHRLARDASMRPEPSSNAGSGVLRRRNSSGESHETRQSDPKHWFDRSNRNPPVAFDHATMDVDPPFFQKQSDSSNEDVNPTRGAAYRYPTSGYQQSMVNRPPMPAHSSSADDFRSVIDDLTIENKRLKEELKRYRQFGPDALRKDKLFEIKYHGLPKKKKMELEATLRDFASSLEGSPTSSQQRKKSSKHVSRLQGSSSDSKHASSSSSHSRPVDSAYASMSTGPSSTGQYASTSSIGRPSLGRGRSSAEQKVETYLREIPEGLLPRHVSLTDKEKKKLVVRRLEQLFTGKAGGKNKKARRNQQSPSAAKSALEPQVSLEGVFSAPPLLLGQASNTTQDELSREARIQLHDPRKKNNTSRDMLSASNSNGENETGENRTGSGSGSNEHSVQDSSPQNGDLSEQRATRPLDLDPDRIQNPSENMQYIRHLGVTAPQYLDETKFRQQDVSMDADGWIHLNLLCNLAQLHILNVTPDYIRSAVAERSAKFQLSRDGRKIRWRGGTEGTKFSSDSGGGSSLRSPDTEATEGSNEDGQRKRQKTSADMSAHSSKSQTKKLGDRVSASSESFHYKPMFVHNQSSSVETSLDDTASHASFAPVENSNMNSRSTGFVSGSGSSPRKKRRRDGAIIYYTGAPFCLDLSGDPSDMSPTTYMTSSGHEQESLQTQTEDGMPTLARTDSGSSLPYRPLVDGSESSGLDDASSELVTDEGGASNPEEYGFCWCEHPEKTQLNPLQACLEPCGLGGVTPEDHFAVLVVTRHPILAGYQGRPGAVRLQSNETTDSIANQIAGLSTGSPRTPGHVSERTPRVQVQVLQERYKELKPLPLPPPAIFYPPFTETTESDDSGFEDDYVEDDDNSDVIMDDSGDAISQRANPHQSEADYAVISDQTSSEEDRFGTGAMKSNPRVSFDPVQRLSGVPRPGQSFTKGIDTQPDSSGATAGEASGYSSGREESG
ncbi:frequency like sequence [Cryphonectria parasitica EP155]|uniref:Frequency like sequence n=1 Tax=Cryphonectria parasitica (strain ATCC 38755 / EP155) TaxID=660469 RepID=A0A9P4XZJ2_CRYP1|nr:frequency like sequence [Cryphonectria parasitica EP155]KAF3763801.1 frequency like sequence [Cryphonectria parasitica EP155]